MIEKILMNVPASWFRKYGNWQHKRIIKLSARWQAINNRTVEKYDWLIGLYDKRIDVEKKRYHITDGFGNWWPANCPKCGAPMQILRPGDARCTAECYLKEE